MDQMISCTPASAVEVREIKAVIKKEMTKGWDCVSLWRVEGVCVYLSSPIDHHLLQDGGGKDQFS